MTWSGSDATSGVAGYDLDVSVDGGDWERLLTNTQSTSHQYPGDYAHGYVFRVTATVPLRLWGCFANNVGNEGEDEASVVVAAVTKYYYFPSTDSGRSGGLLPRAGSQTWRFG